MGERNAANELLKNQADTPGGQQGFQRTAVQPADHSAFQKNTDRATHDEGEGNRDQHVGVVNRLKGRQLEDQLHHIGGVGPEHDQLAMGEIDHPHQAKHNGKSKGGHQQHGADGHTVEQTFKKQLHGRS